MLQGQRKSAIHAASGEAFGRVVTFEGPGPSAPPPRVSDPISDESTRRDSTVNDQKSELASLIGLTTFGFFGLLFLQIIDASSFVTQASPDILRSLWAFGLLSAALVLFIPVGSRLLSALADQLSKKIVTPDLPLFLVGACALIEAVWSATFDSVSFIGRPFASSGLAAVLAIILIDGVRRLGKRVLRRPQRVGVAKAPLARKVLLLNDGSTQFSYSEAADCAEHDLVEVHEGEVVPVTGVIEEGEGTLLHLESGVRNKRLSGTVAPSGSVLLEGRIVLRVLIDDDLSPDTYLESVARKATTQSVTSDLQWYRLTSGSVLGIVVLGLFACAWRAWSQPNDNGVPFSSVLSLFLLLPIPFSITLFYPLRRTVIAALFRRGIVVARAEALEELPLVKHVVVDYPVPPRQLLPEVSRVVMLDDRVEEDALLALIRLLFERVRETGVTTFQGVLEYLEHHGAEAPSLPVLEFHWEKGKGLQAYVSESHVLVGTEEFLINSHIHLTISDIEPASERDDALFVAVDGAVVARLEVQKRVFLEGGRVFNSLSKQNLTVFLLSTDAQDEVDVFGKKAGFDLAHIFGSLSIEQYRDHLNQLDPVLLYADPRHRLIGSAPLSISLFSRRVWEASRTDFTLARNDDSEGLALLLRTAKWYQLARNGMLVAAASATLALLVLCWSGSISLSGIGLTFGLYLTMLYAVFVGFTSFLERSLK